MADPKATPKQTTPAGEDEFTPDQEKEFKALQARAAELSEAREAGSRRRIALIAAIELTMDALKNQLKARQESDVRILGLETTKKSLVAGGFAPSTFADQLIAAHSTALRALVMAGEANPKPPKK